MSERWSRVARKGSPSWTACVQYNLFSICCIFGIDVCVAGEHGPYYIANFASASPLI